MNARRRSALLLFGASALLHAGALVFLLGMLAPRPARREAPPPSLQVAWVKPPEAAAPGPAPLPLPVAPRLPRQRRAPMLAATVPAPAHQDLPAAPAAAPPANEAAPVFDRESALKTARKLASEPDPARAGTLGAQLDARRTLQETQDERLGRSIASAKRSDCIKANGGGSLLTPLMWLLEKKGSGCKW